MSFWQQDAEKVIVTFPGPPSGAIDDVDIVLTQNSFRAGIKSTGTSVCDSGLFSSIKSASSHYGLKTRHAPDGSTSFSVVVYMEKATHGEQWESLFTQSATTDNAAFMPVITKVRTTYVYETADPGELAFPQGVEITVLSQDPSGWWFGYLEGVTGNFPSNFVEVIDNSVATFDVDDPNNVVYTSRPAGGMGMGMGMAMGMGGPGRGRGGMGFGGALGSELGKALKRRTVNAGTSPVVPQQQQQQPQQNLQPFQAMQQQQQQPQPEPEQPQQPQFNELGIPIINLEPGVSQLRATAVYQASNEGEISFNTGDIITVWATNESGWWEGECNGARGWFPANFTEAVIPPRPSGPPHGGLPAMPGRGAPGRGAPSVRARRPSTAQSFVPQEQPQQSGGLPFAVNLKSRAAPPEQPKPAEEQPSGGLPFTVKLKSVSSNPAPAPAQPQQPEEGGGNGLPFPVKLRSASNSAEQPQPQQQPQQAPAPKVPAKPRPAPAKPQPHGPPAPGPKPVPSPAASKPAPPPPASKPAPSAAPAPAPAPAAPAAAPAPAGGAVRDWPSSLPDFDSFCSSVHSAVTGANVRGPQSRNMLALPSERGSGVCSLDGHVQSSGTKDAVPLASSIAVVLYAYCQKNGCAPPAQHLANTDAVQAGIVLTAACSKGKINAPWDVVANVTAFVNEIMHGNVGFSLPVYMKAKQASENVWSAGFELKMHRALPENCDVQAVMDIYFQLCSMQVTMEEGARLAAALAKEDGVAAFAAGLCSLLQGKNVAVVGGESGLALAILPKLGGIAVYASELTGDATTPAIAHPALGSLADKHADVFSC